MVSSVILEWLWKPQSKLRPLSVSAERDKDILTDDKSTEFIPKLIDYLSDKGIDLIGHSRSQEKVADSAIDEGEQVLFLSAWRCWGFYRSSSWLLALCFLGSIFDTIQSLFRNSHVAEKAAGWQHQFVRWRAAGWIIWGGPSGGDPTKCRQLSVDRWVLMFCFVFLMTFWSDDDLYHLNTLSLTYTFIGKEHGIICFSSFKLILITQANLMA